MPSSLGPDRSGASPRALSAGLQPIPHAQPQPRIILPGSVPA
jgi:hypothetical protein